MRRAWIAGVAIFVTLAVAAAAVTWVVFANRGGLGFAGGVASPVPDYGHPASNSLGPDGARVVEDEDWGAVEVFDVLSDGSLLPQPTGLVADVWDAFTRVATPTFASDILLTFDVGDDPDSDLLAYVYPDQNPAYWHFAVNLAAAGDLSYLLTTLIHEYMHLLTLNAAQIPPDYGLCETLATSYGCALEDSYLAAFAEEFWADYGDTAPEPDNSDADVADAFYQAHEEDFVSAYAATNVQEDIAESFMAYVIEPLPDPGSSVVAAKLAFFEQYPELSAIRERIRAEFGDQLQPVWDD